MSNPSYDVLKEIISNRRSIFPGQYNQKEISFVSIQQILESARWAPNHKVTEPWRFKVITGLGLERLSSYLGDKYIEKAGEGYSEMKLKKMKQKALKSGAVIAICMQRDLTESIPEWEEIAAVGCAVQNMWLTAHTLNIGAYWSSPKVFTENNTFLSLKPGEKVLGLFYMGYYEQKVMKRTPSEINSKTEWIKE